MVVAQVSAISLQNIAGEFLRVDHLELKGASFSADTFLQDIVVAMCEGAVGGALNLLGSATNNVWLFLRVSLRLWLLKLNLHSDPWCMSMLCDQFFTGLFNGVLGQIDNGFCNRLVTNEQTRG